MSLSLLVVVSSILSSIFQIQWFNISMSRRLEAFPSVPIDEGECFMLKIVLHFTNPNIFLKYTSKKFIIESCCTKYSYDFVHYFYENVIFIMLRLNSREINLICLLFLFITY